MIVIGTGPPVGYLIGGLLTTKLFGSYTDKRTLFLAFVVQLIRILVSIPAPFMTTWWTYFIFLWLSCFTEGFLVPVMIGMIINSVPAAEKSTAYAVCLIFERLLGMSLGPILYGAMIDLFPHYENVPGKDKPVNISRAGMELLYWSSVIGGITLAIALVI